jgi:GxxExxY protein
VKSAALTYEIIGAAMEVHKLLGSGFLESIYKRALLHELSLRGVHATSEVEVHISYKGHHVGKHRLDIVVNETIIVEIKAVSGINDVHIAQALSYLIATNLELAMIVNFGGPSLSRKRLIKSRG